MSTIPVLTQDTMNGYRHLVDTALASYATRSSGAAVREPAIAEVRTVVRGLMASGQAGAVAAFCMHQAYDYVHTRFGSWAKYIDAIDSLRHRAPEMRPLLLGVLEDGMEEMQAQFDHPEGVFRNDTAGPMCLAVLAGACGRAEQQGMAGLVLGASGPAPAVPAPRGPADAPWAPNPKSLPDWRRKLAGHYRSQSARAFMQHALAQGNFTLCPLPGKAEPDLDDLDGAARFLCEQEAGRLERARLYYVDADMCALADRRAARQAERRAAGRRTQPIERSRVPASTGLVVFATPVQLGHGAPDVVAVSWGRWDPEAFPGGRWVTTTGVESDGRVRVQPFVIADGDGDKSMDGRAVWWVTYYVANPHRSPGDPPIMWETESVMAEGHVFDGEPEPHSNEKATRRLVALFELITQTDLGKPVTRVTEHARKPVKQRSDRRRGITDDSRVRLVTVGAPVTRRTTEPQGTGSSRGPLLYRQDVIEHEKSQCLNPRRHAELGDACIHQDTTVLAYVRGPADAPYRMSNTVHQLKGHQS